MFGYLAIDKPAGMTSRDVVNRVHRVVKPVKCGHTGTLDPLATGVLLIALGPATRLVEFSHAASKSYRAEFLLGRRSDTLDVEGEVHELSDATVVPKSDLLAELQKWIGPVQQTPPKFSAINVQGKRAYDLAREGKSFELPSRNVLIHSIELVRYEYPQLELNVNCGTGTYIRSLGSDIARGVGSDAVMSQLVRTSIGKTQLDECVQLADLKDAETAARHIRPPQDLLPGIPQVIADHQRCIQIRHGIPLSTADIAAWCAVGQPLPPQLAVLDEDQELIAVLEHRGADYRSLRVFQKASEMVQPKSISTPQIPES